MRVWNRRASSGRSRLYNNGSSARCNSSLVAISSFVFIFLAVCIYSAVSETQWVWSQNRQPHISGSGSGSNNNIFPESPPRPSSSSNDALPPGTIRIVNTQGEARLIPGAAQFVSNAINNLVDRAPGGGGSAGGTGGGNGGGLLSIGSGFISSLPQLAGSVLGLLFNRNPSPGSNSNNGGSSGSTVPSSPSNIPPFPVISNGGGNTGGGSGSIPISGGGNTGTGGGNCRCIPLNQCFLPSRPAGDCSGGNSNCCLTSTNTRAITADELLANGNRLGQTKTLTPTDVRVGLLENIVRGSSTVLDDALDLVLHPWLTQEDQQKLATRIANNGR